MKNTESNASMVAKRMFRLLPIQILLAAVGAVNGIVSSLFASNFVGEKAMSAVALYAPVNQFVGAVSLLLVGGSQILCGEYMGKNQLRRTGSVFSLDILISAVFAGAVTAALLAGAALDLIGASAPDGEVRALFNRYTAGQAIGVVPLVLGQQLAAFLSLENRTRRTMAASLVTDGVNGFVAPVDEIKYCNRIKEIIGNKELLKKASQNAHDTLGESMKSIAEKTYNEYIKAVRRCKKKK